LISAKLACGLSFDFAVAAVFASIGTFWRTISEAKTVEAEIKMQAEERVKTEASVLIISISTKKMVELLRDDGNKNLRLAKKFFLPRPILYLLLGGALFRT
jgi:hypothetical protein